MRNDTKYSPPDPYGLDELRAAAATNGSSSFEIAWKSARMRALETEQAARDASPARLRTATAQELEPYRAPDPYAAALKTLRESERR